MLKSEWQLTSVKGIKDNFGCESDFISLKAILSNRGGGGGMPLLPLSSNSLILKDDNSLVCFDFVSMDLVEPKRW